MLYLGFWSAVSGGTFYGYVPVNGGSVDGVGQGLDTGDVIEAPAHGLSNDDRVRFYAPAGGSLPGGITTTTEYYVINSTTNTFQISLTASPGSAVALTSNGQVYFQKIIPEVFGAAGTLTVLTSTLKLEE